MQQKQGVKFYKTPDPVLQKQLDVYEQVSQKKSGENALFKEIVESQRKFAQRAVRWDMDNNVNRRMAYNFYFGRQAGASGTAPKKA
jgi:TRAP-type mannitol/chloroaromatic compound transport system substrate-binding protein